MPKTKDEQGVDHLEAKESYTMEVPTVKFAPQDAPAPEIDTNLLPPDAYYVDDADAWLVLHQVYARPTANSLGDVVLSMADTYTAQHANILVREYWKGIKPGCSLFVPKDFSAQVIEVNPSRSHVEGYKKYTK